MSVDGDVESAVAKPEYNWGLMAFCILAVLGVVAAHEFVMENKNYTATTFLSAALLAIGAYNLRKD